MAGIRGRTGSRPAFADQYDNTSSASHLRVGQRLPRYPLVTVGQCHTASRLSFHRDASRLLTLRGECRTATARRGPLSYSRGMAADEPGSGAAPLVRRDMNRAAPPQMLGVDGRGRWIRLSSRRCAARRSAARSLWRNACSCCAMYAIRLLSSMSSSSFCRPAVSPLSVIRQRAVSILQ